MTFIARGPREATTGDCAEERNRLRVRREIAERILQRVRCGLHERMMKRVTHLQEAGENGLRL